MVARRSGFALSFLLASLLSAGTALAYEKSETSWPGGNPKRFTVCLNGAPSGALERIKDAAQKWKYSKFAYSFAMEKCLDNPRWNTPDGTSYIEFTTLSAVHDPRDAAESRRYNSPGKADLIECDIRFAIDRKWFAKSAGTPKDDENDLLSVALHELGHCLGLDHSTAPDAVMQGLLPVGSVRRSLSKDDVDGRNAIYGAP